MSQNSENQSLIRLRDEVLAEMEEAEREFSRLRMLRTASGDVCAESARALTHIEWRCSEWRMAARRVHVAEGRFVSFREPRWRSRCSRPRRTRWPPAP